MRAAGLPINLISAVHSANSGSTCDGTITGMEYEEFSLEQMYKQGNIEGPTIWAMLMCHLIALLLQIWHECNYCFVVDNWIDGSGQCTHEQQIITYFYFCKQLVACGILIHRPPQNNTKPYIIAEFPHVAVEGFRYENHDNFTSWKCGISC